ncbi:MAG: pyridoxamine 5-phosphate oxidase, partial [Firmicutes bacterium]|nr:pyridoxamine 5-phosphate oxidase [Bacillota bacterium]
KKAALDVMPSLGRMYSEDDSIFEIFCASEAEATFYSFGKPPRTVKL